MKIQLMNAFKYFLSLMVALTNIYSGKSTELYWLWIGTSMASTLLSYGWDLYMDWGLLRTSELSRFGLRSKHLYDRKFYYYAIVSNFIFRFTWAISEMSSKFYPNLMRFLYEVIEGVRRT